MEGSHSHRHATQMLFLCDRSPIGCTEPTVAESDYRAVSAPGRQGKGNTEYVKPKHGRQAGDGVLRERIGGLRSPFRFDLRSAASPMVRAKVRSSSEWGKSNADWSFHRMNQWSQASPPGKI